MNTDSRGVSLSFIPARHVGKAVAVLAVMAVWFFVEGALHPARAAIIPVTNCNNEGAGSLRQAVAGASSGDIVDLSGLDCNVFLGPQIHVAGINLTIRGKQERHPSGNPVTRISSSAPAVVSNSRVLFQPGQGSLKLEWLHISNGKSNDRGGCIASNGNVTLHESSVTDCTVHGIADPQFPVRGGGVYAGGNVRLENGVSMRLNKATSSAADAMGGAVYAGGTVNLVANGSVELVGNHVSASGSGKLPHGGAIYAVTGVAGTAATVNGCRGICASVHSLWVRVNQPSSSGCTKKATN